MNQQFTCRTTTIQFLLFTIFIWTAIVVGCARPTDAPTTPKQTAPAPTPINTASPKMEPTTCAPSDDGAGWHHRVYRVYQDGLDVGREVRTTFPSQGPMGEEQITISHIVTRHKSHDVEIDRHTVQTERFLKENNTFLRGGHVMIDEASVHLSLVGFNGASWEKVQENLDSIESPISRTPSPLPLKGNELIGYQLHTQIKEIAANPNSELHTETRSYFMPKLEAPTGLDFTAPLSETRVVDGKKMDGFVVSALRSGTRRVVVEAFVGKDGILYEETYPSLHQKRILTKEPISLPTEYANPYRGLFSNAYLGFSDGATDATYRIISKEPISLEEFSFIAEPSNQDIVQLDNFTLELQVTAGGPDGTEPPTKKDLSSTKYINTNSKAIRDALVYLKSGGKKGFLPSHRCENAVPVIAKAVRMRKPATFWSR